tara:strand:+ start:2158 stop:3156 length:999 start_codon:yes stop_codon:yes gene_type:complete
MPALLILSGVFLIVLGWIWVAIAARHLPIARFLLALLAAPLTLVLRGRGYSRPARLLILLGILLALAGAALLHREEPERFSQLLAGQWAATTESIGIDGELMGQPFRPERALWRGNDLVFEEGPPDRVRRSLAIRFDPVSQPLASRALDRLPGDAGPWPELLLQWHTGALSQPGLLRVTDDYTLSLDFIPLAGQSVQVFLRLHLPTRPATLLSGEVILATTPQWLGNPPPPASRPAEQAAAASTVAPARDPQAAAPQWQDMSVLALLDEPAFFVGQQIRLRTHAGRSYEGRLQAISPERRIVLTQNSGVNQVDYHFRPADVAELQVRYRRSR